MQNEYVFLLIAAGVLITVLVILACLTNEQAKRLFTEMEDKDVCRTGCSFAKDVGAEPHRCKTGTCVYRDTMAK